jgi:hypothetical protein
MGAHPKRSSPATGRSRLPDGDPQTAEDGGVRTSELPVRSSPATGRSRLPDGGQQSAEYGVVEAG